MRNSIVDKTIVVWFSSGAASAIAIQETIKQYGYNNTIRVVNNPVAEEDSDNTRFLYDVADWLNVDIEFATNSKYPDHKCKDVWNDRNFMSGPTGAPCTLELKKGARQQWEKENHVDWHVLGFTADEEKRYNRFVLTERDNVIPVLIDAGLTKQDCYDRLVHAGIEPPRVYKLGYPNANCIGCVKATSPTYWNHVRKMHPEVFEDRAEQSREIGAKLVRYKGQRIYLDELPVDAVGRPLKSMDIECGIFCEETDNEN